MDPQRELAEVLLKKSRDDLQIARLLAHELSSPDWGIGFHVQQAIEKALKTVLCLRGIEFPRTHNLSILLDLLADNSIAFPLGRETMVILTPYGVLFRYDDTGPTDEELERMPSREALLSIAEVAVNWATTLCGKSD